MNTNYYYHVFEHGPVILNILSMCDAKSFILLSHVSKQTNKISTLTSFDKLWETRYRNLENEYHISNGSINFCLFGTNILGTNILPEWIDPRLPINERRDNITKYFHLSTFVDRVQDRLQKSLTNFIDDDVIQIFERRNNNQDLSDKKDTVQHQIIEKMINEFKTRGITHDIYRHLTNTKNIKTIKSSEFSKLVQLFSSIKF